MLVNSLIFAGLTGAGLVFVFKKLPPKVQEYLLKHALITEIITTLSTMALMGTSLTGLFAAAMVGTVTTILLHIRANPNDYKGLILGGSWFAGKCRDAMDATNAWLISTLETQVVDAPAKLKVA